ncbi:PadR family transcriptional regulator [Ktedonospora formicarum]|nr:PadR family transcriptional regulator [Ktedonospora formicarum]
MTILGYALLSLLASEPLSGYDLAQRMKKPISYFWHARHSQIYPELARLEELGYVTHEVIEQVERPHKKRYTITQAGYENLRDWLTKPTEIGPDRSEIVLKAYAIWMTDPRKAIDLFQAHLRLHIERLEQYERDYALIEREKSSSLTFASPLFGNYATLRKGIGYEREYVDWCRWMIDQAQAYLTQQEVTCKLQ